jgi:uncharacterized membrane protein YqjE
MVALSALLLLTAAVLTFLQITVPVKGPRLVHADAVYYWPAAVASAVVVLVVGLVTVILTLRKGRRA